MTGTKGSGATWLFALGYFAAYVPYSALTKALSSGELGPKLQGLEVVPVTTTTSMLAMVAFLGLTGWWRAAGSFVTVGPLRLPRPSRWTFLSGLCTAAIVVTTTLAYTFEGVSIVLSMVLMRGGVLASAPVVDALGGRTVSREAKIALGLTLAALFISPVRDPQLTWVALVNVVIYVAAYFFRLRAMTHLAKTEDPAVTRRYFVEEQLVATPAAVVALAAVALLAPSSLSAPLTRGFLEVPFTSALAVLVVIGLCSQGTGVFGALVLLSPRENSFAVPLNRISSVVAGVGASLLVTALFGGEPLAAAEWWGAGVLALALLVLSRSKKPAPAKA
ncbi:MAG: hypothetical protein K1X89_04135 [Myxococcaceae bacterium]|nr:hypothetical protein [Myxococcaceae bacterium]